MFRNLPRRKRGLLVTVLVGGLFVIAVVGALILLRPEREIYVPGEGISGLTSTLDRAIPGDAPAVQFLDVAREAGIDFKHFFGKRTSQIVEDMGSGAAWGDYDNDGWQDLYVVNIVGPISLSEEEIAHSPAHNALYHNNRDGTFAEVSQLAGVDLRGWGSGAAWGDYDGDGWIDLFVSSYGENVLFRNRGDGTFEDVSDISQIGGVRGFWAGASWSDYDRDGDLDIYVTGYVRFETNLTNPSAYQYDIAAPASINASSFQPERNLLYRNNGNGTFAEVSESAGVINRSGRSLSASWADFDDDGWPDLYVSNDISDNVLFRNFGDGTFDNVSLLARVADYRGAMGQAVGDWDQDGDLDLFVTHWLAQENALYNSMLSSQSTETTPAVKLLRFQDVADRFGLGQVALEFVGWGTSFFDYDNDGRLDLLVVNGSTLQQRDAPHILIGMRNNLFWNGGPERGFFDVSSTAGSPFELQQISRGAAFADYDNDGDMDVFIVNYDGPGVLLQNQGIEGNHWLNIELKGTSSNTRGIGARIIVEAGGGMQLREIGIQASYMSQNSAVAHFGLGSFSMVERIEVRWPSGRTSTLEGISTDRLILIEEEEGL